MRHRVAIGIERIEGESHRLLVGGEENMAEQLADAIVSGRVLYQTGISCIGAGESRHGVDAAATRSIGYADTLYGLGNGVGGENLETRHHTVECGADINRSGRVGYCHGLRTSECLAHLVRSEDSLSHTVARGSLLVGITQHLNRVAAYREQQVELAESLVGRGVGTQLGGAIFLGPVTSEL